ncbi:MAG TPA: hypothetical protein VMW53_08065 [archaeon]|nr:hypothetical protein [archaeon]
MLQIDKMSTQFIDRNISADTLSLLLGKTQVKPEEVSNEMLLLAKAIDDPFSLPYLIALL